MYDRDQILIKVLYFLIFRLSTHLLKTLYTIFLHSLFILIFSFDQFGKPGVINPDVQRQTIEALLTGTKPPVENCMMPEFIRLAPPLHVAEDEVRKLVIGNENVLLIHCIILY